MSIQRLSNLFLSHANQTLDGGLDGGTGVFGHVNRNVTFCAVVGITGCHEPFRKDGSTFFIACCYASHP